MSNEEKFTLFWGGPFSQWCPSVFVIDGVTYNCAEQYMMSQKALFFGDLEANAEIMSSKDPAVQKAIGRRVRGFDADRWSAVARHKVYKGSLAKFTQNLDLMEALRASEGTTIVEASPYDKIWGIGRGESDPLALSRDTWDGLNWLGEVLTILRERLALGNQQNPYPDPFA